MSPSWRKAAVLALSLGLLGLQGCLPGQQRGEPAPTWVPEEARVVAIGDLHGDLQAARRALELAGAIDSQGRWIGGDLVVVQTGDILDRGDADRAINDLFVRLQGEASKAGGTVYVLNGNHELMNASLDFRYVTQGGFAAFADFAHGETDPADSVLASLDPSRRGRAEAFRPGGPWARLLSERNTVLIVGRTLFVHGGILPEHLEKGLEALNEEIRTWLRGESPEPEWIHEERSPVWTRLYSDEPTTAACDTLAIVLADLDVDRMVVGHTVQQAGITAYCGARVWCIDVGLAKYYGGPTEVLEIRGDVVRGLR
jgi:hypothetical protein